MAAACWRATVSASTSLVMPCWRASREAWRQARMMSGAAVRSIWVVRPSGGAVGAGENLKARSRVRAGVALCCPLLCLGQQLGVVPGDLFHRVQERGAGLDSQRAAPDVPPVPERVGRRAVVLGGFLDGEVARQRLVYYGTLSRQVG